MGSDKEHHPLSRDRLPSGRQQSSVSGMTLKRVTGEGVVIPINLIQAR